jgi:hypothetical protein
MRRDDYRQTDREVGRSASARALNSVEFDPSTPPFLRNACGLNLCHSPF